MYRAVVQLLVLWFIFFATIAVAQPTVDESTTCNVQSVPDGAMRQPQGGGVVTLHYPDPRSVPPDYSGCLNTWGVAGEKAFLIFVARFDKGVIQFLKMADVNIACSYEDGQLAREKSTNASMCPPAHEVALKKWQR